MTAAVREDTRVCVIEWIKRHDRADFYYALSLSLSLSLCDLWNFVGTHTAMARERLRIIMSSASAKRFGM